MASKSAEQGDAPSLTFLWAPPRAWYRSRLLRFLLVSVLGHLLAFLLFQIVNRETVTAPERERELQILSSDLPEHQALLQAVEAEVPLGALSHQLLSAEGLLKGTYRSAFLDSHVSPKEPPRWNPTPKKLAPSFPRRSAARGPEADATPPYPGGLVLDSELSRRLVATPQIPGPPAGKLLESPTFLLCIAGTGEVQFVFLDKSSGDSEADSGAERALRQARFEGGSTSVTWGQATLIWKSAP